MWRLLFSACALRLSGHDVVHCHCRRHFMPEGRTRIMLLSGRVFALAVIAVGSGWVVYRFLVWAISVPGAMRIG